MAGVVKERRPGHQRSGHSGLALGVVLLVALCVGAVIANVAISRPVAATTAHETDSNHVPPTDTVATGHTTAELVTTTPSPSPPPPPSEAAATRPEFRFVAHLVTDYGELQWGLYEKDAPQTVANFRRLIEKGFYNQSCIYRYEKGFVLQGGGCSGKSSPKTVPLEYKLPNVKYSVAMARSSDPHSGGSEWFINLRDNSEGLGEKRKGGYAVFAKVLSGFDVIAAVKKLPTHHKGLTMFDHPQPKIRGAWVSDSW